MNHITSTEYWAEIRSICSSAVEEYQEHGEHAYGEDVNGWLSTWLNQAIDGHRWVICTHYNTQVLTHSDNESAAWDHGIPREDDYSTLMAVLAYNAMEADVRDHIDMAAFEAEEAS